MSNLVDDFGDPDRSRASRAFSRAAHLLPRVAVVVFGAIVVDDLVGGVIPLWLSLILVMTYLPILWIALWHNVLARICLRCMQDVPPDAPVRAQRRRFLMWIFHHSGRVWLTYLVLFGAGIAGRKLLDHGLTQLDIPAVLVAFSTVWAGWTHHRLRPWCPFCPRWDDGQGPREHAPVPNPSGVKS